MNYCRVPWNQTRRTRNQSSEKWGSRWSFLLGEGLGCRSCRYAVETEASFQKHRLRSLHSLCHPAQAFKMRTCSLAAANWQSNMINQPLWVTQNRLCSAIALWLLLHWGSTFIETHTACGCSPIHTLFPSIHSSCLLTSPSPSSARHVQSRAGAPWMFMLWH